VHRARDLVVRAHGDGRDGEDARREEAEATGKLGTEGDRAGGRPVVRRRARKAPAGDERGEEREDRSAAEDGWKQARLVIWKVGDLELARLACGSTEGLALDDLELGVDELSGCGESRALARGRAAGCACGVGLGSVGIGRMTATASSMSARGSVGVEERVICPASILL
jgi:hypothetical protein